MSGRAAVLLLRNLYRVWRGGQLRFRMETYGLYYPALPYTSRWWRTSPRYVLLMVQHLASYAQWLGEMDDLGVHGPSEWWARHRNMK